LGVTNREGEVAIDRDLSPTCGDVQKRARARQKTEPSTDRPRVIVSVRYVDVGKGANRSNSGIVVPVAKIVVDKGTGEPMLADQLIIA
jgi:hypothetical protein